MRPDINKYLNPVTEIIQQNIGGNDHPIKMILENWSYNKQSLYERMGNKTIIESQEIPINIDNDYEVQQSMYRFRDTSYEFIEDAFLKECYLDFFFSSVMEEGFKTNIVQHAWDSTKIKSRLLNRRFSIPMNFQSISIPKGIKFSKSLKFFFDLDGSDKVQKEEQLKDMQNCYSTYRQQLSSKKTGKLFLSIDPFDFLSISDNNHNWSSCHSTVDGDYRIGNLNYMADEVTLVGYYASNALHNEELEVFENIKTWNSKRWRVLVHVRIIEGQLLVAYNRQYPFHSTQLIESLDDLLMTTMGGLDSSTFSPFSEDVPFCKGDILCNMLDTCQYSDFNKTDKFYVRIADLYRKQPSLLHPIEVGYPILCLECGKEITKRSDTGICDSCSDEYYCQDCGGYYSSDSMHFTEDGDSICDYCYNESHTRCDECGDDYHIEDTHYISLNNTTLCTNCFNSKFSDGLTIVITVGDFLAQSSAEGADIASLSAIYKDIQEENTALIESLHSNNKTTINIGILYFNRENKTYEQLSSDRDTIHSVYKEIDFDTRYYPQLSNDYPLSLLSEHLSVFPLIDKIILMGSCSIEQSSNNIDNIIKTLIELGLSKDSLDYSRIRVI